jgi:hypothetical protein
MRSPGFARSSASASMRPACAAPVQPSDSEKSPTSFLRVELHRARQRRARAAGSARRWTNAATSAGFSFARAAMALAALESSGTYACVSAKRSSQLFAKRCSGSAPSRQVLERLGVRRLDLGDDVSVPNANAAARRRAPARLWPSGAPTRTSETAAIATCAPAAASRAREKRAHAGPHRAREIERAHGRRHVRRRSESPRR